MCNHLTGYGKLLMVCIPFFCFAKEKISTKDDYVTVAAEYCFTDPHLTETLSGNDAFLDSWAYIGLPGFRVLKKSVFSAIEIDLMTRHLYYAGDKLNENMLQRYGLFAGMTVIDYGKNRGTAMIGGGVASDFADVGKDAGYVHLIYDHRLLLTDKVIIGLGILFSYHFDSWRLPINLLPTVRWKVTDKTLVNIGWDNLEVKQLIIPRISLCGEIRYDLSFFRLKNKITYEFETVSAGGGFDYLLGHDFYLRVRYKGVFYKRESVKRNETLLDEDRSGKAHAIKIACVYTR